MWDARPSRGDDPKNVPWGNATAWLGCRSGKDKSQDLSTGDWCHDVWYVTRISYGFDFIETNKVQQDAWKCFLQPSRISNRSNYVMESLRLVNLWPNVCRMHPQEIVEHTLRFSDWVVQNATDGGQLHPVPCFNEMWFCPGKSQCAIQGMHLTCKD